MQRTDALREGIALEIRKWGIGDHKNSFVAADAIIALGLADRAAVIEECAKVADAWLQSDFDESSNTMAANIADDIRAIGVRP